MYWVLSISIEIAKMLVILIGIMNIKTSRYNIKVAILIYMISIIFFVVTDINSEKTYYSNIIFILSTAICTLICSWSVVKVLLSWLISTLSDSIILSLLIFVFNWKSIDFLLNRIISICTALLSIIIFVIISYVLRRLSIKNVFSYLSYSKILLIIIGILSFSLNLSSLQIILTDENYVNRFKHISIIASALSGILFVVIAIAFIISDQLKSKYKYQYEISKIVSEEQQLYCKILIQKAEETNKLRHDFNNHIFCISHLFASGEDEKLVEYLNNLTSKVQDLKIKDDFGNNLINAIISDLKFNYPQVKLLNNGIFPTDMSINSIDICTIFYNLFKNAFEAVCVQENAVIQLNVQHYKNNLLVIIQNPVTTKVKIKNNHFIPTTKFDFNLHGYGLQNVSDCIEQLGGSFKIECTNTLFTVEILLINIL